jgi:bacillithiol system protein YtxJ
MNWIPITENTALDIIKENSFNLPQLIFKHSTRCSISSMAKNRLDRSEAPGGIEFHFLDLIAHRSISSRIAELFNVAHESPQVLLIKNGECVYDESHSGIRMDEIMEQVNK